MGTGRDIIKLFSALLNAAGIRAYVALAAGRDDFFSTPIFWILFPESHAGRGRARRQVEILRSGISYLEPGMLLWPEEGVESLILHRNNPFSRRLPLPIPREAGFHRKASFRLQEDGTLEGTVEMVFHGHRACPQERV